MKKLKVIQIGVYHDHGTSAFNSILRQRELFEVLGFAVTPEELSEEPEHCEEIIKEYRDERNIKMYTVEEALSLAGVKAAVVETRKQYLNKYAVNRICAQRRCNPCSTDIAEPGISFSLLCFYRLRFFNAERAAYKNHFRKHKNKAGTAYLHAS